jgi:DNA-binding winged helix-turn-helix (wHTH) protein
MGSPVRAYEFEDVSIDLAGLRVVRGGVVQPLEPKSFKVLRYLIENRDRVVSKEELIEAVSQDTFVTDNALTRTIAQIRKALDDDPKQPRFIETAPKTGYRFIGELRNVTLAPKSRHHDTGHAFPVDTKKSAAPYKTAFLIAAAVAASAIVLASALLWTSRKSTTSRAQQFDGVQFTTSPGLDVTPAFSPDGSLIAYASDRSGAFELYVRTRGQAGRELQITRDGRQNVQPSFSPDGRSIV